MSFTSRHNAQLYLKGMLQAFKDNDRIRLRANYIKFVEHKCIEVFSIGDKQDVQDFIDIVEEIIK
jgi:hypothetical protein